MWGAYRWAARFLLLVMLVPAVGPMAMACAVQPEPMHCMRQSMSGQVMSGQVMSGQAMPGQAMSAHAAEPAKPCHHSMAQSKAPQTESSELAFQATDDGSCCQHHCCCGATTSEWARPASSLPSFVSLAVERAISAKNAVLRSSEISAPDSARAPPRS